MADAIITTIVAHARDLARTRRFYEQALGLRPFAADASSVRYPVGLVDLEIRGAADAGVEVEDGVDESVLMVFLVDDLDAVRSALEARSVEFQPTLRYEIGATAACFDPDGHNVTLYQPSAEAMTWPSAAKIEAIAAAASRRRQRGMDAGGGLSEAPLVYLFLFVRGTAEAASFYGGALQLPVLEQDDDAGVVKYDGGTVILATHVVGGDAHCAVEMDLSKAKRISPVLEARDPGPILHRLALGGVATAAGPAHDGVPVLVFEDVNRHRFWLQASMRKRREDVPMHVQ